MSASRLVLIVALLANGLGCADANSTPESPSTEVLERVPVELERMPVSSSAMRSVGYDEQRQILQIEFHNGDVYQYFEVPEEIHDDLMAAESHGRYFHREIRGGDYRYEKVEP